MFYVMDSLFTADQLYTGSFVNPNGHITPANQSDSAQYFQQGVTPSCPLELGRDKSGLGSGDESASDVRRSCPDWADYCPQNVDVAQLHIPRRCDDGWHPVELPICVVGLQQPDLVRSFQKRVHHRIPGLGFGETILGGKPSGNSFLIYTNKGIWELYVLDTANPPPHHRRPHRSLGFAGCRESYRMSASNTRTRWSIAVMATSTWPKIGFASSTNGCLSLTSWIG